MKNFTLALSAFIALFIISCEGPQGPPGFDGFDGSQFEAAAFEIQADLVLNTTDNKYELLFEPIPSDIPLNVNEVMLIYRLEDVVDGLNVWRQLPQPFFTDDGTFFYNFDFTLDDFSIFAEPEFDVSLIPLDLVQDQVFRIVVIPIDLGTSKLDTSNMEAVLSALNIDETAIRRIE